MCWVCTWQCLPGQELLRSSLERGECVGRWARRLQTHLQGCSRCATITCTALKNWCDSKWRDLAKALGLSCLIIYSGAIVFFCVHHVRSSLLFYMCWGLQNRLNTFLNHSFFSQASACLYKAESTASSDSMFCNFFFFFWAGRVWDGILFLSGE